MATVTVVIGDDFRYDPDGSGSPLTIEFPESTDLSDGRDFWLININKSSTGTITIQANSNSPLDEIEDPTDPTAAYATSHSSLSTAGYRMWYVLDDENFSVPTWICKKSGTA